MLPADTAKYKNQNRFILQCTLPLSLRAAQTTIQAVVADLVLAPGSFTCTYRYGILCKWIYFCRAACKIHKNFLFTVILMSIIVESFCALNSSFSNHSIVKIWMTHFGDVCQRTDPWRLWFASFSSLEMCTIPWMKALCICFVDFHFYDTCAREFANLILLT